MKLIDCDETLHSESIRTLFNHEILHTTNLYFNELRTEAEMREWFAAKRALRAPVIGAVDETGELLGFSTYGTFRPQPGFLYTMEHSVYVDHRHRRKGVGRVLLEAIVKEAGARGVKVLIGAIDGENDASCRLHASLGFIQVAHFKQVGFKFGRRLDVVMYQKHLDQGEAPRPC